MEISMFVPRFLSRLFTDHAEAETLPASAPAAQANGQIRYDAELIGKLKADHAELFCLYGELKAAADRQEFASVPDLLKTFRLTLQTHLMLENVKFYAYVKQNVSAGTATDSFVADVKNEMDGIARAVVSFTNKYGREALTPAKAVDFVKELDAIGGVLTKRVKLEETRLYTLYMPL